MTLIAVLEEHPYAAGAGVLVVGVLLVLTLRRPAAAPVAVSTSGYDPGYNASVVAANASIMAAQLAANGHAVDTAASLSAHISDAQTALGVAQIAGNTAVNATNVAGNVASQRIAAGITGMQLTNVHDIAIAGMSRDVALGAQQISDNANARSAATQDAADQLSYLLGSQSISAKSAADLGQLANANAYDSRHVALADTVSARAHIEARFGIATQQMQIASTQAMNTDNNQRMLAARTIQVASDNTISAGLNDGAYNIAKIQTDGAVSIARSNASALNTQSTWAGISSILGNVAGVAKTAIAA